MSKETPNIVEGSAVANQRGRRRVTKHVRSLVGGVHSDLVDGPLTDSANAGGTQGAIRCLQAEKYLRLRARGAHSQVREERVPDILRHRQPRRATELADDTKLPSLPIEVGEAEPSHFSGAKA
jgi:hypothetical protein